MGISSWFAFKSGAQRKKELDEAEKRFFPLGHEQKGMIQELLKQVVKDRLSKEEKLMAFLTAKDLYLQGGQDKKALRAAERKLEGLRIRKPEDRAAILALVKLDDGVRDLAQYPSVADVLTLAHSDFPIE